MNVNTPEVLFIRDRQASDKKADLKKAADLAVRLGLVETLDGTDKQGLWETVRLAHEEIAKAI